MRSTTIGGGLSIHWGLLGGLFAKIIFFFADGGVCRGWKVGKLDRLGWDEEVDTMTIDLPLKDFEALSLACCNVVVKSTYIEVGTSPWFSSWFLVYECWLVVHISWAICSIFSWDMDLQI